MQPSEFWQTVLLNGFADNCVWHVVIPTLLCAGKSSWEKIASMIDMKDTEVVSAQRANMLCVQCGKNTLEEDDVHIFGIRVLVAKKTCTNALERHVVHRTALCSSLFCLTCAKSKDVMGGLDANTDMHNLVLDLLEGIARDIEYESLMQDLSGPQVWKLIMERFALCHYKSTLHTLGKIDPRCSECQKPGPKSRCSSCHFARYCNDTCSRKDWPLHKGECALLKLGLLIYPVEKAHIIKSDL